MEITSSSEKVTRKWNSRVIRWRLSPTGAPEGAQALVASAFAVWKDSTSIPLTFEYAGETTETGPAEDGYCDIHFGINLTGYGFASDVIAVTFRNGSAGGGLRTAQDAIMEDADILINPQLSSYWVTETPTAATQLDLKEVLIHEIGHLVGLAHSFLIDAIMFPSKPPPGSAEDFVALFRNPKRTLSQDDISWANYLYSNASLNGVGGWIEGRTILGSRNYIGAHVIAMKTDAPDLSLQFYPNSNSGDLIVKGLSNVSTFSEQDGNFTIPALPPGSYKVGVQDSNRFLTYSLSNVNTYLASQSNLSLFPNAFWTNPDCENGSVITTSNVDSEFSNLASVSVEANKAVCGVEVLGKTQSSSTCRSTASLASGCGGGGCQLNANEEQESNSARSWSGLVLIVFGTIVLLWSFKIWLEGSRSKKKKPLSSIPRDKDLL